MMAAVCHFTAGLQRECRSCDFSVTSIPPLTLGLVPGRSPSSAVGPTFFFFPQTKKKSDLAADNGTQERRWGLWGRGWRPLWWNLTLPVTWSQRGGKHQEEREWRIGLGKWNKGHMPVTSDQRRLGIATLATNGRLLELWSNYVHECISSFSSEQQFNQRCDTSVWIFLSIYLKNKTSHWQSNHSARYITASHT